MSRKPPISLETQLLFENPTERVNSVGNRNPVETLETQSIHSQYQPRLSFSSVTTLITQTSLSEQEEDPQPSQSNENQYHSGQYEEIQPLEQDIKELYTEEELYSFFIPILYRKQLETTYSLRPTLPIPNTKLEDPTPYLHSEMKPIPPPEIQSLDCIVVDKEMLDKRIQVLYSLNRPYHPLLYTSFSNNYCNSSLNLYSCFLQFYSIIIILYLYSKVFDSVTHNIYNSHTK